MALTIEFEQKIADGVEGMVLHYPDSVIQPLAQDGSGNLQGATAQITLGDFSPTITFDSVGICAKQTSVEFSSLHMYSTDGIYVSWLFGDKQQVVIFLLEYDISEKLLTADIGYDVSKPINKCKISFVVTPDLFIEEQRSLLNPGAKITIRFQAGDSAYYKMGEFYVDRSSTSDLKKTARLEARGLMGKPLQDQSFDESYDYPYDAVSDTLEAIMILAGYTTDQYRIETTTDNIGISFDRKKKIYDGIEEILEAQGWQIRERAEGYIVIGASDYSEFATVGDYEFEYGVDCYSRSTTDDDDDAYTRVCVHTSDFSVAVYDDVEIYQSWRIGAQKTKYVEVADGTSSGSATAIAADLATKLSNSGTLESYTGPFRPYLIDGDTAKITKDAIETTIGVITNIRLVLGRNGFSTEFDVDSGGVVGTGRMSDYIKKLAPKTSTASSRSYS